MELSNSKRLLFTASYVTQTLTESDQADADHAHGGALRKLNLVRALDLKPAEIDSLQRQTASERDERLQRQFQTISSVAKHLLRRPDSHVEVAAEIAAVADSTLLRFAKLLEKEREPRKERVEPLVPGLVTTVIGWYSQQIRIAPVGWLHLERIEMFPAGVEKGELVFTVPMAPGETVTVSHKEWSTSSREYEQIVQDYFESYSERGVAEKTDASLSTENEAKRSSSLNFGATLSGGYGPVTLTTTFGAASAVEERESVRMSRQHNREVTEKSSARARQEHKVSVKLEEKKGVEDSSFRTISNPNMQPVRIDYYRMMRKWRTNLYRYGLRLTYDITLPTPGVRIWAYWRKVAEIDAELGIPFVFTLTPEEITFKNVADKAKEHGAIGATPPPLYDAITVTPPATELGFLDQPASSRTHYGKIDFHVPEGYTLKQATATAYITVWPHESGRAFIWLQGNSAPPKPNETNQTEVVGDLAALVNLTGAMSANYQHSFVSSGSLSLRLEFELTEAARSDWRLRAWNALRAGAHALHQQRMAQLQEQRDRIYRDLAKDTLSLRRLEREEMVRLIMLWLIGPGVLYTNAPGWIASIIDKLLDNESAFLEGSLRPWFQSPTMHKIGHAQWSQTLVFGEIVKFVQQAVEWENLLYFLYPYFWGSEHQGRSKLLFSHPDPEHEKFLRAGYARVVVTIRPGFEEDFVRFVETGNLQPGSPPRYLTMAEEVRNFALVNYANIPPANPEQHIRPLLYPQQRTTWATMEKVILAIEKYREAQGKYPAALSELAGAPFEDAWGNPLVYVLPGSGNDYDLISFGADGVKGGEGLAADISSAAGASLVGSWFDYTPTSGIDIEVDTKPEDLA